VADKLRQKLQTFLDKSPFPKPSKWFHVSHTIQPEKNKGLLARVNKNWAAAPPELQAGPILEETDTRFTFVKTDWSSPNGDSFTMVYVWSHIMSVYVEPNVPPQVFNPCVGAAALKALICALESKDMFAFNHVLQDASLALQRLKAFDEKEKLLEFASNLCKSEDEPGLVTDQGMQRLFSLGELRQNTGHVQEAVKTYEELARAVSHPKCTEDTHRMWGPGRKESQVFNRSKVYEQLALAYRRTGNMAKSIECMRECIKIIDTEGKEIIPKSYGLRRERLLLFRNMLLTELEDARAAGKDTRDNPPVGMRMLCQLINEEMTYRQPPLKFAGPHKFEMREGGVFSFKTVDGKFWSYKLEARSPEEALSLAEDVGEEFGRSSAQHQEAMEAAAAAQQEKEKEMQDKIMKSIAQAESRGQCCDHCGAPQAPGKNLLRCSKCKQASYCSKECQIKAWKTHKKECNANTAK